LVEHELGRKGQCVSPCEEEANKSPCGGASSGSSGTSASALTSAAQALNLAAHSGKPSRSASQADRSMPPA
jgi:hypothetical protein